VTNFVLAPSSSQTHLYRVRGHAGYFVGEWRRAVLGQTNLAVANPHRKSLGRYDCDIVDFVQFEQVRGALQLTIWEIKRITRSYGTGILDIRGHNDGCGERPAVTVLTRRQDVNRRAVRHMRNLVSLRRAQAGCSRLSASSQWLLGALTPLIVALT
jgi:hypothetical protein